MIAYPEDMPDGIGDALYVDEHPCVWSYLSEALKYASNTASWTVPTYYPTQRDASVSECLFFGSHIFHVSKAPFTALAGESARTEGAKKKKAAARKEAGIVELRQYSKQFHKAKLDECTSWKKNDGYKLIDMRKQEVKNYVTGSWVLTVKREPNGTSIKAKARWVLRGFQDRQKWVQQTDSPTSTRPAFRLGCQQSAIMQWGLMHIDIKTALIPPRGRL